jgi:nucleoside-diphosphate-sugar epimerase
MNARVLVTGASGFVGGHVCDQLAAAGYLVRAAVRANVEVASAAEVAVIGELGAHTDWSVALRDVDFVIHAAARVAGGGDASSHDETNVRGTESLAAASVAARVQRVVLLSTVKVNGEASDQRALSPDDSPHPRGHYAISKLGAERALARICAGSDTTYAIVRAPLVYGPRVRGNFLKLMHWVDHDYPLPFGAVRNRRSLVSVWNLSGLVERLLRNSQPNRTWMVSDDEDLSTPELIRRLSNAMGRRARLVAVPEILMRLVGRATGRHADVQRLCGSLVVDVSRTRESLNWKPTLDVADGLARTVAWYRRL